MRLRIAFLVYDFSSPHSGGIATYVHNIGKSLAFDGHQVEVFTGRGKSDLDLPYKVTTLTGPRDNLGRLELSRRFADALYHRKNEFDLVEATDWGMEGYFCIKQGIAPCIIRFHTPNSVVEKLNGCSFRRDSSAVNSAEKEYFGLARYLSAPSKAMITLINQAFLINQPIVHLANPADFQIPEVHRCAPDIASTQSNLIGFLGRLERRKGVYELAEALVEFLRDYPLLQFHFAGPDTRSELGSVGRNLKEILRPIQNQVKYLGYLNRDERNRFLSSLRFCVLPSLWENAPYACVEAMAIGVNLDVTSGSGFEEMVGMDDPRVAFADPGNSRSLLESLRSQILVKNPRSSYQTLYRFRWDNLRKPTVNFYKQIAADNALG